MRTDPPPAMPGRVPAFAEPVHVGRPNVPDRAAVLERIGDLLDRKWLTNNGPLVQEFEARVASMVGVKHCIATCNGTVALELLIRGLGLTGEVIVPSFTFVATAHALQWQQITPVFCDIDPLTHNIDPARVERMITPRTTGIIGVHVWGRPCDTDAMADIASRHRLALLFDAAHAFACSRNGVMAGGFGDAEVFSFHATKFFSTFEGGAVVTNNDELAAKIRLMKNFGFAGYDNVIYIGTNGKMPEVCAAMGLVNLDSIEAIISANRRNYETYRRELAGVPGLRMVEYEAGERWNYQYVVLEVDEAAFGLSRDDVLACLHAENVLARRYFHPGVHRMEPYRSYFPNAGLLLGETEKLTERVLVLPTGMSLNPEDIAIICRIIREVGDPGSAKREHRRPAEAYS